LCNIAGDFFPNASPTIHRNSLWDFGCVGFKTNIRLLQTPLTIQWTFLSGRTSITGRRVLYQRRKDEGPPDTGLATLLSHGVRFIVVIRLCYRVCSAGDRVVVPEPSQLGDLCGVRRLRGQCDSYLFLGRVVCKAMERSLCNVTCCWFGALPSLRPLY